MDGYSSKKIKMIIMVFVFFVLLIIGVSVGFIIKG